MHSYVVFSCILLMLLCGGRTSQAQQPLADSTVRVLTVSPLVGPVIDQREKITYGLFYYYSADSFVEARFEQHTTPDSTVRLRTQLRDGRTVLRLFTAAELATVRATIAARQHQLTQQPTVKSGQPIWRKRIKTRWLSAELRNGNVLNGELLAQYSRHLELLTVDSGLVTVHRDSLVQLTPRPRMRPRLTTQFAIGNGHRLVLAPTARSLRRGEGYLQQLDGLLLGAGYGFTEYFSVGVLFSALPILPPHDQFLLVTPKVSARLSDNWHVGGGLMYTHIPKVDESFSAQRVGIGYGVVTYGSADNNVSGGLGYAVNSSGLDKTPALHYGAQKRLSRSWALTNEGYVLLNDAPGTLGLFGTRFLARRLSAGLGGAYALPFGSSEESFVLLPVYLDLVYRFGKGSRLAAR